MLKKKIVLKITASSAYAAQESKVLSNCIKGTLMQI